MNIRVKNVRGSYLKLRQAEVPPSGQGEAKFSGNFIGSDDSTVSIDGGKTWKPFVAGMEEAIEKTMKARFNGKVPVKMENWAFAKADGSGTRNMMADDDGVYKDGYTAETYYLVATKTESKSPGGIKVFDQLRQPLPAESGRPVSGDYINVNIYLHAYDSPGNGKGVTAFLEAVQFLKAGEPFGSAPVTGDAFDEEEVEEVDDNF